MDTLVDSQPSNTSNGQSNSAPSSTRHWKKAGAVMTAVKASRGFRTLRDQVSGEAFIEKSRIAEKVKTLGEGGFATVDLCKLDGVKLVAVKRLKTELLESDKEVDLFLREVKLLRKLRHSRIVEFIGVGGSDETLASPDHSVENTGIPKELFLVQEYCPGGSLRELVYKQMCQPFSVLYTHYEALRWSIDIAKALKYLHSVKPKVVHRDLKLDNVLLGDADKSKAVAKLADFGLAKLMAGARASHAILQRFDTMMNSIDDKPDVASVMRQRSKTLEHTLTKMTSSASEVSSILVNRLRSMKSVSTSTDTSIPIDALLTGSTAEMTGQAGSYAYMAPEVLRNEDYDEKADIYSFGVMMYNMFYKVIPTVLIALNGTDEDVVFYAWKVANGYRPDFKDSVPKEINAVIEKCWKGIPSLRPGASEVVADLEEVFASGVCGTGVKVENKGCCSVM